MRIVHNPWRGRGIEIDGVPAEPISTATEEVRTLLQHCPIAAQTPMLENAELAELCGVAKVWLKDERQRMGLGSFKATGAAYVIASDADQELQSRGLNWEKITEEQRQTLLQGKTYACASAGNHGLSIAAGARVFGAKAVIFLSNSVPESFAVRLQSMGAQVMRAGDDYEASLEASRQYVEESGSILLSDSSWPGYMELAHKLMEGYTIIGAEAAEQLKGQPIPTHIFLQAGVGGLAAAITAMCRREWGDVPQIVVVEPTAAPALLASIEAGQPVITSGPVSNMGRLDCKEPSYLTLAGLSRQADWFVALSDEMVAETVAKTADLGIASTPSGLAGLAILQPGSSSEEANTLRQELGITSDSRVLVFVSEQPD